MRSMLLTASGLVFAAGVPLLLGSTRTARYFAWTINPPLTAAFLGGAYWASCFLEYQAARQATWERARIAVPAVLAFSTLTLAATLLHRDKFHFGSRAAVTEIATWGWVAVYAAVPGIVGALLVLQLRTGGGAARRAKRMTGRFRVLLGGQAVAMSAVGLVLFMAPGPTRSMWPWALTPLTARAVGAWLIGIGLAGLHAVIENDWDRVVPALTAYAGLGVLELSAVARFSGTISWQRPAAWVYLAALVTALATGCYGWWAAASAAR